MHVTAKADYAVRAVVELASSSQGSPRKVDEVAQAQSALATSLSPLTTPSMVSCTRETSFACLVSRLTGL